MAAVAEKMVDAAIEWMVQSILGNLFNEKLEAWIHGVELADDVQKLKSAMRYVQMVVEAAKGRKINNVPLGMSLGDLKELLYEAEDVMDELDYYRLQEQIASGDTWGGTTSAAINAATSSSWLSSSIQLGKNLFENFGNFISKGKSRGKRKREDDEHIIAVNTQLGRNKKSELSLGIQHIASKLRGAGDDVRDGLKIDSSSFVATSNQSQRTLKHTHLDISYIVERKVYGRDEEVESILKLMENTRSKTLTVLPIVGMGGIGKTTLAQLVYNHPTFASQFQIKIWVCVSVNSDVLNLTREMLECVSEQKQTETGNLIELQEDLEKRMESKRFLIVLDDVWDDMNEHSWNNLIAPLRRNQVMGNVIVVTTRRLHVVEMTGTVEPVKLDGLERDDLWLLFVACAFGDEKHQVHPSLYTTGKQIAQKLSGSPLEAKTVGALLGWEISIDHWTDVLNSEEWKSQWNGGCIMPVLKLSYDYLPVHLQQCFRYCCLFPKGYQFDGAELAGLWISQGFVHGRHAGKLLEDTAKVCLADLVNSGFLQVAERGRSSRNFVMHDLMHDLAWEVSRADFSTVNDLECEEILPTVRHLSIVRKDQHVNAFPYESFEKSHLQVTPVRQLRSLVFIGQYDSRVLKYFENIFKEAQSLRLLYVSTTYAGFCCLISNLVGCTHIRYIKVRLIDIGGGFLPQALTKFFHLQVLHVVSHTAATLPSGVNKLASLQHLLTREETLSTIAGIQSMTALQVLHKFKVQNASGFDIRQLRSLNQLVLLGIYQLENVRNGQEASEARLIGKRHLEDLLLSWDDSRTSGDASNRTSAEVLQGLKPHKNLKHLQITGCNSSSSPRWLGTDLSVTSLQSLHLEKCKEWTVLPPLEKLPSLRKLKLINMPNNVVEVAIPCLEELVLIELPRLEKCVATYRRELTCHLQTLIIKNCPELKDFTPFTFQNFFSSEVEQNSWMSGFESTNEELSSAKSLQKKWLSGLRELTIHGCPHLILLHPLPPATNTQVSIEGLSMHPTIKRNSGDLSVMSSDELRVLDAKILAFQNLTDVISLQIKYCPNLVSLAFEGLTQLANLSRLSFFNCGNLVPSYSMPDAASEGWQATNCPIFPYVTHLEIKSCGGIAGKWLTQMLPHMQSLWVLDLEDCPDITSISIHRTRQEEESGSMTSASNRQAVVPASLGQGEFHIPLNVLLTLKKFCVRSCPEMKLHSSNVGFEGFITLTWLQISGCPMLLSSAVERLSLPPSTSEVLIEHLPRKVQPYFPENQTSLKALFVRCSPNLQSLWLHSCTALELLRIHDCAQLVALEGLQYLSSLRSLEIEMNPELSAVWFRKHQEQQEQRDHRTCLLPPSIEILSIIDLREEAMPYLLSTSLPSLSELVVLNSPNLTTLQLGSFTALRKLRIHSCDSLASLEGLQCLGNLTDLEVSGCSNMLWCLDELLLQKAGASNIFLPELVRLEVDGIPSLTTSSSSTLPRSRT